MYSEPFYITEAFGNNAFSYNKRPNKKLFVPSLTKINNLDDIKFGDKIVFEDYDFNGNLQSCCGLENFYEIDYLVDPESSSGGQKKKIYLVDNHNHVYFFWHKSRFEGIIGNNSTLYHIDEHTDLRDPGIYLEQEELKNLKRIFEYTNYVDVGNYIIPAIHDGLVKEMHQIRSESELNEVKSKLEEINSSSSIILNLDLDFFQPKLDYIDYNLKKELIQKLTKKADLITISTSPFFIN
ncbi:hypothetical protein EOM39_04970 [Candidatus Gracilibacteria bacterium]|nr:hypothetical protein [Candidatus Gracilibacteria bacterium]